MSIFDSLRRPKWQHKNPAVRTQAIASLKDQHLLLEVTKTETDPDLQAKALARITDPNILDKIIDSAAESLALTLKQQATRQRLEQLLPGQPPTDYSGLANIDEDATLVRIASLTDNPELLSAAITHIKNPDTLKDIAHTHSLAKIRLQAAQNISDKATLKKLMGSARGRDKAVYRHCKTVLDKHQADKQTKIDQQQKIQQLSEAAGRLAQATDAPDYNSRYRGLEQQWPNLAIHATAEQLKQFQQNMALCADRLAIKTEAESKEKQKQLELTEANKAFPALLAEFEALDKTASLSESSSTDPMTSIQLSNVLDDLDTRWRAAHQVSGAPAELELTFKAELKSWRTIARTQRNLIDKQDKLKEVLHNIAQVDQSDYQALERLTTELKALMTSLPWPDSHQTILPSQLKVLQQASSQLKDHRLILQKNLDKNTAQIDANITVMLTALDKSNSKDANKAHNEIKQALNSLPSKHQRHFNERLNPLITQLREIQDWQGFAIEPKKVELCASMKALVGSDEDPDTLAGSIKVLQDEWKQLGALPKKSRDQQLWKEFKAAGDEAWLPCKVAFAEQASLRQANFESRMALVAQLQDYEKNMAWPLSTSLSTEQSSESNTSDAANTASKDTTPDWALVQKTLDAARESFKSIQPLDQQAERKSQKALRAVCDKIYNHIKDEYQRNIARKEQLVSSANQLVNLEDLQGAIDQAKDLQRQWKSIGITPVKHDRKLWTDFRAACDDVFTRLDEQRNRHKAKINEQVTQAEALLEKAHELVNTDGDKQCLHVKKELADLTKQFYNIELPDNARQRLSKDFKRVKNKAEKLIDETQNQLEQASWNLLAEKIQACAQKNTNHDTAITLWEKPGNLPKGINIKTLETFWQQGPSLDTDEQSREACIALEIFGDLESPVDDKSARMNYQMQRLVKVGGQQAPQTVQSNINDFIDLRPASDWALRFCSSLAKIRP